jgi:hypothetical protein
MSNHILCLNGSHPLSDTYGCVKQKFATIEKIMAYNAKRNVLKITDLQVMQEGKYLKGEWRGKKNNLTENDSSAPRCGFLSCILVDEYNNIQETYCLFLQIRLPRKKATVYFS